MLIAGTGRKRNPWRHTTKPSRWHTKSCRSIHGMPSVMGHLAGYYAEKGDRAQSIEWISRARSIDPNGVDLLFQAAIVHRLPIARRMPWRTARSISEWLFHRTSPQRPRFRKSSAPTGVCQSAGRIQCDEEVSPALETRRWFESIRVYHRFQSFSKNHQKTSPAILHL